MLRQILFYIFFFIYKVLLVNYLNLLSNISRIYAQQLIRFNLISDISTVDK